jgi:opacity protein-like surface antigen
MAVAPAVVTTPPAPAVVGVTPSADLSAPRPVRIETVAAAVRPVAERSAPPASRFSTAAPASSEPRPVGGETYVAGFFGINFPSSGNIKLSETQVPGCPAGTFGCPLAPGASESDLKLKNSVVYGAKVGHYFERLRWLGVEGEVFNTNAHEKQQNATINEPGVGVTPIDHVGATMRVLTLAANVLARYPGERFQPYAGIGLGLFFAHRTSAPDSHSSTQPGLNAEVGLRYRATDRVGLFGEYKYNRARLHFQETSALFARDETYQAHMLVFGAYLSFN